jgi:hypothetical protein
MDNKSKCVIIIKALRCQLNEIGVSFKTTIKQIDDATESKIKASLSGVLDDLDEEAKNVEEVLKHYLSVIEKLTSTEE